MTETWFRCSAGDRGLTTFSVQCTRCDTRLFRVDVNTPWGIHRMYGEQMVLAVCPCHLPQPLPEGWVELTQEEFDVGEVHSS